MPGFVANGEHLEWIALYNLTDRKSFYQASAHRLVIW
jgi:hypothetical protein